MNEDEWANIEKVPVYTEKELATEFDSFNTILNGTNGDWNKRLKAIKRLQGLILGGAPHIANFPTLMSKLHLHINAQLNDLRSAISKEACVLICLAAKHSGEILENFCDKLIVKECLLKTVNSATKLTAEQGHACIVTLLQEVRSARVVPKIIEEATSKNASLRQKIAEYVQIIIEYYDNHVIEKYQSIIEGAITLAISDANKDVRQITRKTFQKYTELYPSRGDKLLSAFDLSVQKALIDEGIIEGSISPLKKPHMHSLSGQIAKGNQRPSSAMSGKMLNAKTEPTNEKHEKPDFVKSYSTAYTFSSDKIDGQEAPKKNQREPSSAKITSNSSLLDKSPTAKPVKNGYSTSAKYGNRLEVNTDKGKLIPTGSPTSMSTKATSTRNRESCAPVVSNGRRSTTPMKPSNSPMSASNKTSPRPSMKDISKDKFYSQRVVTSKKQNYDFYQTIKDDDLKFLLEKTNDENWATRSNSFEKINEFVTEMSSEEEINNTLMSQIIQTHIQHITDNHYKVVIACQESFSRLITLYAKKVLPYMDKIIPLLFVNLSDGKEKVAASTNFLLNIINKVYNGDDLFPSFLKSLDHSPKASYKISVLEFMNVLTQSCEHYFTSSQTIKICITKLANIMNDFGSQKKVILACFGMIVFLRELDSESTLTALASLREPMLTNIRAICAEYLPDLERDIRNQKVMLSINRPRTPEVGSPLRISKAQSSKNNTNTTPYSPTKVNYSFTSESKSAKKAIEKEHLNNSVMSPSSYGSEKRSPVKNKLTKDSKHTSSSSSLNPIHKSKTTIEKVASQYSSTRLRSSPEPKEDAYSKLKLMQFDFDDEDDNNQSKTESVYIKPKTVQVHNTKEETTIDLSSLEGIGRAIEQFPLNKKLIEDKLPTILSTLLIHPSTQNVITFEHSLDILKKVLTLPINLRPHLDQIISGVTSLYHSPLKVYGYIDNVFKIALELSDAEENLDLLLDILRKEDHPVVQILIKTISNLILRNSELDLSPYLSALFEIYAEIINHNNPDVRKNVVFSIVDLHFVYKEEIEAFMQEFSASHQKLIEIYIQKRSEKSPKN